MIYLKIYSTGANDCTCDCLLEHWKKYSGQPLSDCCAILDCVQRPEVGVLIRAVGSDADAWYIVPLCTLHSQQKGKLLYLTRSVNLVSSHCSQCVREVGVLRSPIREANPCQVYTYGNSVIEVKNVR